MGMFNDNYVLIEISTCRGLKFLGRGFRLFFYGNDFNQSISYDEKGLLVFKIKQSSMGSYFYYEIF